MSSRSIAYPGQVAPKIQLVQAERLEVGYFGEPVCAPVTFTLSAGESIALVGSNGAGKSTVLRAVLGSLDPVRGSVTVFGAKVDERSTKFRAEVAGVLDDDAYFPALTVFEHLMLTSYGHGVPDAEEVVLSTVKMFGLDKHLDMLPAALSSGLRRRLLLASAFVRPQRLLVLDEPEQRLDQAMRADLAIKLQAVRQRGGGVLFATHDPVLLQAAATRALVIGDEKARLVSPAEGALAIEPA